MHSEELLKTLIDLDVLETGVDEETLAVAESFRTAVEDVEASLESGDVREPLAARVDDEDVVDGLAALGEEDPSFAAHYCVLADRAEGLSHDDLVRTVAVLVQFRETSPRTDGAPDAFLPVRGDQLPTLLRLSPRSVVYVWMDDCDPCDLVRESFDELFEQPPDDFALFAVYGPEWAELLHEKYDVSGAPTALFVRGDEVDSRLQGAHYTTAYEGEIETLRELTDATGSE